MSHAQLNMIRIAHFCIASIWFFWDLNGKISTSNDVIYWDALKVKASSSKS